MSERRVLRVLAIDDDSVSLAILSRRLQECGYEVTSITRATEALALLREKRNDFDIVITDVMMPEMDGFKLLELVRLEIGIPVILVSSDSDVRTVVKGVKSGAQDYFVKPVHSEDLRKLWEHVTKKPESYSPEDESKVPSPGKSEEDETSNRYETESNQNSSPRRKYRKLSKRIIWTAELHKKFLDAVQQLQVDDSSKIIPTKILEIMNEPNLSRENVASHLQKYRKSLMKQREATGEESCSSAGAEISASISNPGHSTTNCSDGDGQYVTNGMANNLSQFVAQNSTPSPYLSSENAMLLPSTSSNLPHPQKFLHPASQIVNQMHSAPVSSPLLGNITSLPVQMPGRSTHFLKVDPRTRMFDDYSDNSWMIPYIMSRQPIPSSVSSLVANHPGQYGLPVTGVAPHTQSYNALTSNYQMPRSFPNQMIVHPQVDSLLQQTQCSLPGYHDVQNISGSSKGTFNFNGDSQVNEFVRNEPSSFHDLLQENPDGETIDYQFFSDDLSALLLQIGNDTIPRL